MNRRRTLTALVVVALASALMVPALLRSTPVNAQTVSDSRFRLRTIASLDFPTGMQFTPSGTRLFVNERDGRIRIIKNGVLLSTPFATVSTTREGEGGLLGLALHPQFESGQPYVYVFYTRSDGAVDRVERFKASGDRSVSRQIVFDNMPASLYHHGGSVVFGNDGKLYISNGEQHDSNKAQDPHVLGGKVYRLNADGSIPSDNPFSGEPTWAYGLRNPFGMTVDKTTGLIWVTENGPESHDEVNRIVRGGNYGWPVVKGDANDPRFIDPVLDYPSIIVPTMTAFGGNALPSEYRNNLFFGTYGQEVIHRVRLNASHTAASSDTIFIRPGDGVIGMTMGPDGLYYTTPSKVVRAYVPAAVPRPAPSATRTTPSTTPSPTPTPTPTPSLTPTVTPSPSPTDSHGPLVARPYVSGGTLIPLLAGAAALLALGGFLVWRFLIRPRRVAR